jgi:hypothetical protein
MALQLPPSAALKILQRSIQFVCDRLFAGPATLRTSKKRIAA